MEMGLASFPFQHENNVFWIWPIRPLYFCPKEYCPFIHLLATSLSPQSCTVGPSSRVRMISPRVPSPSVSSRYLSFLSLSFLCTVDSFTLSSANVTNFVLPANAHFCSFTHPVFLSGPVRGNFVPDVSTIVPLPLVFPSRVVARVVSHSSCLRGLPPPCTSPSENAFARCRSPHWVFRHKHILSAISSYRKSNVICIHIFLAVLQVIAW